MSDKVYLIHTTRTGVLYEYTKKVWEKSKMNFIKDGYRLATEKEKKDAGIPETKPAPKNVNKASSNKKKEENPDNG